MKTKITETNQIDHMDHSLALLKERVRVHVFEEVKNCHDGHCEIGELGW